MHIQRRLLAAAILIVEAAATEPASADSRMVGGLEGLVGIQSPSERIGGCDHGRGYGGW